MTGELRSPKRHPLLPNVLSTRMWIKQRNRRCETLPEKWAEPFSTFAELVRRGPAPAGYVRQPAPVLRQAWRMLMENHPHDSICGCSLDQVHTEMAPRFDQVEQVSQKIVEQSLDAIAGQIQTAPPARTAAACRPAPRCWRWNRRPSWSALLKQPRRAAAGWCAAST